MWYAFFHKGVAMNEFNEPRSITHAMNGILVRPLTAEEAAYVAWRAKAGQVDEWTTEEILEREA